MNFNLRTFPLTGSDPKRSNQGQQGKTIEKLSVIGAQIRPPISRDTGPQSWRKW